ISETCPFARSKLKDWITFEPWLPTSISPLEEGENLLPQATRKAVATKTIDPSSHANRFDILSLISIVCGGSGTHSPGPSAGVLAIRKAREKLNPLVYQESAGRANPQDRTTIPRLVGTHRPSGSCPVGSVTAWRYARPPAGKELPQAS